MPALGGVFGENEKEKKRKILLLLPLFSSFDRFLLDAHACNLILHSRSFDGGGVDDDDDDRDVDVSWLK